MTDLLRKQTDELLNELRDSGCDIQEYINTNPDSFIEISLKELWRQLVEKSGMSKSNIINKSDFSYVYFYDVIAGKKIPTRDKIVRLILAMRLSVEDCQEAMRYCGKASLYPRIKRDSILIYAINNELSIMKTQELLQNANEKELV